jgi:hypothetical protein
MQKQRQHQNESNTIVTVYVNRPVFPHLFFNGLRFKRRNGKKVNVKVKFTLEQAVKVQRWSRGIVLFFFNLGARWLWMVNATTRSLYSWERETRYPLYKRLGGPQSPSERVRKISPSTGIRSPDRPARNDAIPTSCPGPRCRSVLQPKAEHDEYCADDGDKKNNNNNQSLVSKR